ncbi:conjugal transfer protein TraB, partial [Vibrio splendidus]
MFDKFRERFFSDKEGDFDRGGDINAETTKRNQHITSVIVLFLVLAVLGVYQYTRPKTVKVAPTTAVEFGAIVDKGFTEKDNQSALTQQQMLIATLTKEMRDLKGKIQGFKKETEQRIRSAKLDTASLVEDKVRREMQSTVDELK